MRKTLVTIGAVVSLACASSSPVPPTQPLELDNGTVVQLLGLGTVALPDGEVGLLIDYVTGHPLHRAVDQEVPYVWWEFVPQIQKEGFAQGLVRVMPTAPKPGRNEGRMCRGCLTEAGETLWLHLDCSLTESNRAAGKQCRRSTAAFRGEPTLRIAPPR
jgi:hypothetical protein